MGQLLTRMAQDCFVAFGVVFGAAMMSGLYAVLTFQPPSIVMMKIAESIKIWALVAAIGGTIDTFRVIESNFLDGRLSPAFRQILYLLSAFFGAHLGVELIRMICGEGWRR